MGATNHTSNYNLPQWIGTDKPTFLGDLNDAFLKVDTQMKANADSATSAESTAGSAESKATAASQSASQALQSAQTAGTNATQALSVANNAASTANSANTAATAASAAATQAQGTANMVQQAITPGTSGTVSDGVYTLKYKYVTNHILLFKLEATIGTGISGSYHANIFNNNIPFSPSEDPIFQTFPVNGGVGPDAVDVQGSITFNKTHITISVTEYGAPVSIYSSGMLYVD